MRWGCSTLSTVYYCSARDLWPRSGFTFLMPVKVMVVDDEPMIRRFVTMILSGSGYEVVDADTPEQAVQIMDKNRDFDLLVTDVVMPNVSGRELASRLTERQPGLRVLFMSGFESGALQGASFLQKPFRIPELLERVRQILA